MTPEAFHSLIGLLHWALPDPHDLALGQQPGHSQMHSPALSVCPAPSLLPLCCRLPQWLRSCPPWVAGPPAAWPLLAAWSHPLASYSAQRCPPLQVSAHTCIQIDAFTQAYPTLLFILCCSVAPPQQQNQHDHATHSASCSLCSLSFDAACASRAA